jgi:hypothetical protein
VGLEPQVELLYAHDSCPLRCIVSLVFYSQLHSRSISSIGFKRIEFKRCGSTGRAPALPVQTPAPPKIQYIKELNSFLLSELEGTLEITLYPTLPPIFGALL